MATTMGSHGWGYQISRGGARTAIVAAGFALIVAATAFAVALVGHNPEDPSWIHAVGGPVTNPLGAYGANVSAVLLQSFGLASWLLVTVLVAWGIRMIRLRPLAWPWMPIAALPLALLAFAGFLAPLDLGLGDSWLKPLGGVVGDLIWTRLTLTFDGFYALLFGIASLVFGVASLGLRWGEAIRTSQTVARAGSAGATWTGSMIHKGSDAAYRQAQTFGRTGVADDRDEPKRGLLGRLFGRKRTQNAQAQPAQAQRRSRPERRSQPDLFVGAEPDPQQTEPEASTAARAPAARRSRAKQETAKPAPVPMASSANFTLPAPALLAPVRAMARAYMDKSQLEATARELEQVLDDFGVRGEIVGVKPGPVVTLYELDPAPGIRASRVINLAEDIARSLSAVSVRVAVVRGSKVIGIEMPNPVRETVFLRELVDSQKRDEVRARLPLWLGKDIGGGPVLADLSRMPHLLIAGTTGSGKSVAINAMILSLLYQHTPDECRLIMIDPKVIELSVYDGIPHLLSPVVTEPAKAVMALKWVVRQMDHRYRLMSHLGVRDIHAYNRRLREANDKGEQLTRRVQVGYDAASGLPKFEDEPLDTTPMPLIVVIVDEVADLMLAAGKDVESQIQRLSQKARAAGIHLIVATQRPSVDVLTGVIKANMPCRISFRVSSKIDSRTILGEPGAEQLLGQGDMLYMTAGEPPRRVHGALVTDAEVERVVRHLKTQGEPDYEESVTSDELPLGDSAGSTAGGTFSADGEEDKQYSEALAIVAQHQRATTSFIQRQMRVGYNTAARLIERMEQDGYISPADHVGRRQILTGSAGGDDDDDRANADAA
ncbi:MAG: DNA translocase FtsK [Geminicoccaceae bacterium]